MKRIIRLVLALTLFTTIAFSQNLTQNIRGSVVDHQTKTPLIGVTVVLLESNPMFGATTDKEGIFRFKDIPVGRHSIQISYIGYNAVVKRNLILTSAKEVIVEVELEEQVNKIDEVVVKARDKKEAINKMSSVSARSFSVEETNRYAGTLQDPSRMAGNYAGVISAGDERNDIIIRGNSPTGLLWRLEGINIPNPNHFAANGTTGGPIGILNNNNLSNSDFYTGAFPSEYGNAMAGAFDLNLRKGNNENHEFTGQFGMMGTEIGIEGPLSKKKSSSYIANYRYSTISLLDKTGAFTDIPSIPKYQDLTFMIDLPTTKRFGKFYLFGIGGLSNMEFKYDPDKNIEGEYDEMDENKNLNSVMFSDMGVLGLKNIYSFKNKSYLKSTIAITYASNGSDFDTVLNDNQELLTRSFISKEISYKIASNYHKRINVKNSIKVGIHADLKTFNYVDSVRIDTSSDDFRTITNFDGNSTLFEAYAQWQHKFSNDLVINSGLHYQHYGLNNTSGFEPRIGLKWKATHKSTISAGYGMHSQTQPLAFYLYENKINGKSFRTNKDLGLSRANHFVLGYDLNITENMRLKSEVYYQYLDKIPVEQNSSYFSILNVGADFDLPEVDSLVNKGKGENYGIELTLEKFFSDNYYFLLTGSLYNSKYKGSDNIERNTVFNGNYALTALGGFEKHILKNSALIFDLKINYAGGLRYIPINLTESRTHGHAIYNNNSAYENQYKDYFRADVKVAFRFNQPRMSHYLILDIMNVLNTKNVFQKYYDPSSNQMLTAYQYGMLPNLKYKIEF